MQTITLPIDQLNTNSGTQPRAKLNDEILKEYTEIWARGGGFPAVEAVYDGKAYFLWNGFHRINSALTAGGITEIEVSVTQGDLALAQWLSFSANKAHGLRRSNEEIQAAVQHALQHPLAAGKSDRAIAEHCGVSHQTVALWREKHASTGRADQLKTRTGLDGRTRDTSNIGAANRARTHASPMNSKSKIAPVVYQFLLHNHPRTTSEIFAYLVGQGLAKKTEENREYLVALLAQLEGKGAIEPDWWAAEKSPGVLENETSARPFLPAAAEGAEETALTPPSPLSDQLGRVVPEPLRPIYELLTDPITRVRQHLIEAQKVWHEIEQKILTTDDLKWIAGFSGLLDMHNLMDDLKQLAHRCRSSLPFTQCVYCKGTESDCRACKGTAVITESVFRSSPAELREEGSATLREINKRDEIESQA